MTTNLIKYSKVIFNNKMNEKQKRAIIRMILKDALAFKNTDVVKEVKDLFNLDFSHILIPSIPEKKPDKTNKKTMMLNKRYTLKDAPSTDVSETESVTESDWSDIGGISRLKLRRQTGYYKEPKKESYETDTELDTELEISD